MKRTFVLAASLAALLSACQTVDEQPSDRVGQATLRLAYLTAADHASTATDVLVRAAGTAGLYEGDGIERCWRDANAVNKHITVTARSLDRVGRILLGLPPPPGPI